ncbi:MAG: 2TM domain-containing protein [Acidimicrobiia bacterium]|jgi:hypothetical protein
MSPDTTNPAYDDARKRVEAKMGFYSHLAVFVVINVVFLIVAGIDWLWVTLFWGIGLVSHGWSVFFASSSRVEGWKEKQIQKELGRGGPDSGSAPATGSGDPTTP